MHADIFDIFEAFKIANKCPLCLGPVGKMSLDGVDPRSCFSKMSPLPAFSRSRVGQGNVQRIVVVCPHLPSCPIASLCRLCCGETCSPAGGTDRSLAGQPSQSSQPSSASGSQPGQSSQLIQPSHPNPPNPVHLSLPSKPTPGVGQKLATARRPPETNKLWHACKRSPDSDTNLPWQSGQAGSPSPIQTDQSSHPVGSHLSQSRQPFAFKSHCFRDGQTVSTESDKPSLGTLLQTLARH